MSQTRTFALADPHDMEGDPFEVAQRAAEQAAGLARLLVFALHGADLMARNAMMERNLQAGEGAAASSWDEDPQHLRFKALAAEAVDLEKTLMGLARAAGYNPKRPPKEE